MAAYRLVTLPEARAQLSLLDSDDDVRVDRLVRDASQIVMRYLGDSGALAGWTDTNGLPIVDDNGNPSPSGFMVDSNGDFVLDTDGDPIADGESIIPGAVRAATLLVIARLDDDREGNADPISPAVESLLATFKDPTVA